jgi:GxxExxY protein
MSLRDEDHVVGCAYRADFVIDGELLLELKSVERIIPVHDAQVPTYLRSGRIHHGLLINFNVTRLVDGLRSFLMTPKSLK